LKKSSAIQMVKDLRKFADFVELKYDELPKNIRVQPYSWVWGWDAEESVPEIMASVAHAGLGTADAVKKDYHSSTMNLDLVFGEMKFTIHCERDQVCVKRVVGTKKVKKQVPIGGYEEQEVDEEIVEWDCTPLLAGASDE